VLAFRFPDEAACVTTMGGSQRAAGCMCWWQTALAGYTSPFAQSPLLRRESE